jgi:hypothetical protein
MEGTAMPADLQIEIVEDGNGSVTFRPQGGLAGDALEARKGDNVRWRNKTGLVHQPWPTDEQFNPLDEEIVVQGKNYLSNSIPRHSSGSAAYSVIWATEWPQPQAAKTIHYCCLRHPTERGMIIEET